MTQLNLAQARSLEWAPMVTISAKTDMRLE